MHVDYINLNKVCSKDNYPLPLIDQLVDATSGHEPLTFIDTLLRDNQIRMTSQNQEYTSFIMGRGIYYYRVMSFGLKNTGVTY